MGDPRRDLGLVLEPTVAAAVTFGMMDGTAKRGSLSKFAPNMTDLKLEAEQAGGRTEFIAGERLAYIAWHRDPNETLPPPAPGALPSSRIAQTAHWPLRLLTNAMDWPSGEKVGRPSSPGLLVRLRASPPPNGTL